MLLNSRIKMQILCILKNWQQTDIGWLPTMGDWEQSGKNGRMELGEGMMEE